MSCFNFTSVCKIGKLYLFCKNEGLLIEKDDTSVLQFTVHMCPVLHLMLLLQTHPSCRAGLEMFHIYPPEGNSHAPTSFQFNLMSGKCLTSHCMMLYRKKSNTVVFTCYFSLTEAQNTLIMLIVCQTFGSCKCL